MKAKIEGIKNFLKNLNTEQIFDGVLNKFEKDNVVKLVWKIVSKKRMEKIYFTKKNKKLNNEEKNTIILKINSLSYSEIDNILKDVFFLNKKEINFFAIETLLNSFINIFQEQMWNNEIDVDKNNFLNEFFIYFFDKYIKNLSHISYENLKRNTINYIKEQVNKDIPKIECDWILIGSTSVYSIIYFYEKEHDFTSRESRDSDINIKLKSKLENNNQYKKILSSTLEKVIKVCSKNDSYLEEKIKNNIKTQGSSIKKLENINLKISKEQKYQLNKIDDLILDAKIVFNRFQKNKKLRKKIDKTFFEDSSILFSQQYMNIDITTLNQDDILFTKDEKNNTIKKPIFTFLDKFLIFLRKIQIVNSIEDIEDMSIFRHVFDIFIFLSNSIIRKHYIEPEIENPLLWLEYLKTLSSLPKKKKIDIQFIIDNNIVNPFKKIRKEKLKKIINKNIFNQIGPNNVFYLKENFQEFKDKIIEQFNWLKTVAAKKISNEDEQKIKDFISDIKSKTNSNF